MSKFTKIREKDFIWVIRVSEDRYRYFFRLAKKISLQHKIEISQATVLEMFFEEHLDKPSGGLKVPVRIVQKDTVC